MRDDGQVTGAGATAERIPADDPDRDGTTEEPRGGWPSWVLVAACVVPPLVLAEAARRVLTGAYDEEFYGGYPSGAGAFDGAAPEISTGRRFGILWALVGAPAPLWGGVVAALLALVVVLAGRPSWLVPDRWGRRVAAVGSWVSAALALGSLVGVVEHASAPADDAGPGALRFFLRTGLPDDLPGVAGALAVLVPALVVPAVAGAVLWRVPARGHGERRALAEPRQARELEEPRDARELPEPQEVREPPALQEVPEPPAGPPTVSDAERALYRRPG
ncbi:hypothetical protein AB1207_07010 [Kineococcus endophyticus]|uniref:Uncharacterized protein n=1 Tax=Kineococcus endophyticus TaxID=1181883 RepID=A0ABV3P5H8_9ACTN